MAVTLDLADIQGNIFTAYGKLGFPRGRVILLNIADQVAGRDFVTKLLPMVTTALRWSSRMRPDAHVHPGVMRPDVAVNIGFTWYGLLALGVPTRTLRAMPDEFIDGMARRASMLGDNFGEENPNTFGFLDRWDKVWRNGSGIAPNENRVHALVTLNAQAKPEGEDPLETCTNAIMALVDGTKIKLLKGHQLAEDAPYQELSALLDETGAPSPKEHFGYTDAIGDPTFEAQYALGDMAEAMSGNGAVDGAGKWRPLATGEFLLGYPDEAQEIAGGAMPLDFSRNGTFVAYRKLHQNVATFRTFLDQAASDFALVFGLEDQKRACELLLAKLAGRWTDGVPLAVAPRFEDWERFNRDHPVTTPDEARQRMIALRTYTFRGDPDGTSCPLTSHTRRVNTRDMLDPGRSAEKEGERGGSVLNNRRRVLRRGLPYGASPKNTSDDDEHGIVMLVTCASLFRQFEFVQQQWLNYGLDSGAGNDTCPLVGNHARGDPRMPDAKFVIAADPKAGHPPFILSGLPQFVETRGGDYFFMPSMTALRMIGMGVVDPT